MLSDFLSISLSSVCVSSNHLNIFHCLIRALKYRRRVSLLRMKAMTPDSSLHPAMYDKGCRIWALCWLLFLAAKGRLMLLRMGLTATGQLYMKQHLEMQNWKMNLWRNISFAEHSISVFHVFLCLQLHGYRGKEPLGLQIFIGTADERILKPHAFYQVHRITGKTVTTTSYEKIINGTKVLEIPLEPKNNMKAVYGYHKFFCLV